MDLEKDVDYERICLGEGGFQYMLNSLVGDNTTLGKCDMGVSSITASTERENRGIRFSRATHRSALAILVHAPLKQRGMWAFFEPLHLYVWMALLGTVVVIPFFVFFFEAVFARWYALPEKCLPVASFETCLRFFGIPGVYCCRTAYMKGEKLDIAAGLVQCLWHSVSHTLSIDVFHVRSFPARIITAAYAFLVLILTNTYTANLAAFLTVNQLDTTINSVEDLRGKVVSTVEPYIYRLYDNHRISATSIDGAATCLSPCPIPMCSAADCTSQRCPATCSTLALFPANSSIPTTTTITTATAVALAIPTSQDYHRHPPT